MPENEHDFKAAPTTESAKATPSSVAAPTPHGLSKPTTEKSTPTPKSDTKPTPHTSK